MSTKDFLIIATLVLGCSTQRSPYAGRRPVGYPEMEPPTTTINGLSNKFGEGDQNSQFTTTERLPIEANGDIDLINRLRKIPQDQQPFWFINWQALEAHRRKPQTFPLKPNTFVDTSGQFRQSNNNAFMMQ